MHLVTDQFHSLYTGACERSCACSTCHVILPQELYDILPEPEDDENDMLDMAFGLTDTSRLGCQVYVTKEMKEMGERGEIVATLPSATRNMFVDGEPIHWTILMYQRLNYIRVFRKKAHATLIRCNVSSSY